MSAPYKGGRRESLRRYRERAQEAAAAIAAVGGGRQCECGCGDPAPIARRSDPSRGWVKGQPIRFITGHHARVLVKSGEQSATWKGGKRLQSDGYVGVLMRHHPRAGGHGYVREHILIVERAMGHALPPKAEVHHVDENKANNDNGNLVACQGRSYHQLLHRRMAALLACGDANALKCTVCKSYDRQDQIVRWGNHIYHRDCANDAQRRVRSDV